MAIPKLTPDGIQAEKTRKFIEEYRALVRKYGLMIVPTLDLMVGAAPQPAQKKDDNPTDKSK